MSRKIDVLVIGAGPGGYPAAIRLAQLGKSVIIVDKGYIGGECLNWGCIPSKALISAANFYYKMKEEAHKMGITAEKVNIDIKKLQEWKGGIQSRLIGGIEQLLKGNGVSEIIKGTARFINREQVEVTLKNGTKEIIEPANTIIATGTSLSTPFGLKIDEIDILSPKGALRIDHVPENIIVIGGGIVGLEMATLFAKLGSIVKIIESLPSLLPGIDPAITRFVQKRLKEIGVEVYTGARVEEFKKSKSGTIEIDIITKKDSTTLKADKIMITIEKRASVKDLEIEKAGIKTGEQGFITVNEQQLTNVPNVYAVGDCTGKPFFAHKATKQGIVAAEVIAGQPSVADFRAVPVVIFSDPQVALAGMNEKEAKEAGHEITTGRFSFGASGRALTIMEELGFVKVIVDKKTGILLGIQIVGSNASDLISEAALALEMAATIEDLGFTIHPHPTLPETIMEAAESALGKAIHTINPAIKKI
ncbi:MAG: dihydrolipoyl dehydrogenase [Candidatus Hodarchaeales archaeon]|jgi:dihydrolipoamide dehydrogenase